MRQPQLIVFLDSQGAMCIEAASENGARRKIPVSPGCIEETIKAELLTQSLRTRDTERANRELDAALRSQKRERETRERSKRVYDSIATRHSISLANHVVPSLVGRYDSSGQNTRARRETSQPSTRATHTFSDRDLVIAAEDL